MKRRTKLMALCVALSMVLSCFVSVSDSLAKKESKTFSDTFEKKENIVSYDADKWTLYGNEKSIKIKELAKAQKVLKADAQNVYGEYDLLMSKDWYWEIHSFSFDMYIPANTTWENSGWAFLDFVDIEEPIEYAGDYGEYGEPMCYGAMKVLGIDDFGLSSTTWKDWGFKSDTIGDTWISVKVISENATTGKIMIAPKGQAFDKTKAQRLTLAGNRSFYNSNIVLGDFKFTGYMFDNFVIKTDTGTFKEDFEDGTNDLFEEITINELATTSFPVVNYGGDYQLAFKKAKVEDRLIANTKFVQENKHLKATDNVLETSFKVDFRNNNTKERIAYVFGLSSNDASPFCDNYGLVIGKDQIRFSFFEMDGKETVLAKQNLSSSLRGNTISISLTKSGHLTVSVGGAQVLKCSGVEDYDGYAGFAAHTDISKEVYVDDVTINNTLFNVITTKSWKDDFSENKIGTGTDSDYAWFAQNGSIQVSGEEVSFLSCVDGTFFGPAYEYETFELSFEMTSILTTDDPQKAMYGTYGGCWIGLDFGKKSSTVSTYGTYGMLAIRVVPEAGQDKWEEAQRFTYRADSSELTELRMENLKPIPASWFENISYDDVDRTRENVSPKDAVCFKFVGLEDRVELYMKRASDKKYELYSVIENVDPKGYVALACTGYAHWTIDNFKIKNTAKIYNEAPPIVIEEKVFPTLEERGVGVEDTYWEKEQKLNEKKAGISPIIWVGGACVVALLGVGAIVVMIKKAKKHKKD